MGGFLFWEGSTGGKSLLYSFGGWGDWDGQRYERMGKGTHEYTSGLDGVATRR